MQNTFYHSPIAGTLLLALAALAVAGTFACTRQPVHARPEIQGQDIIVDASSLEPDVPRFFTYDHEGRNVSFFVLKIGRNVFSFLDACASCYTHRRGYRYDEDAVVTCRYCDMKFSIYKLEKGLGGCYPIRIEGRLDNSNYLIPLAAIRAQADKF
jgi:uncharacterized membrane protein